MTRIAENVVRPLSNVPGVRIMVGTRRTRDAFATLSTLDGPGPLIRALGARPQDIHDVDLDDATLKDITEYVERRLLQGGPDSPFNPVPLLARQAAEVVAAKSNRSFLAARLHSRYLRSRGTRWMRANPTWPDRLSEGLTGALRDDLDRFDEPTRTHIRELLRPLAWAEGAGLPRNGIWEAIATELARRFGSGTTYTDDDIAWALRTAGYHILEVGDTGRPVYRLYHQFYGDFLRQEMTDADTH